MLYKKLKIWQRAAGWRRMYYTESYLNRSRNVENTDRSLFVRKKNRVVTERISKYLMFGWQFCKEFLNQIPWESEERVRCDTTTEGGTR